MWVLECSTFTSYPASLNNGFFKIHKLLNYLNLDFWSNSLELYLNFPQSYFNRFIKVRVLVSTYLRTVEMSGWHYSSPNAYKQGVFVYILSLMKITSSQKSLILFATQILPYPQRHFLKNIFSVCERMLHVCRSISWRPKKVLDRIEQQPGCSPRRFQVDSQHQHGVS